MKLSSRFHQYLGRHMLMSVLVPRWTTCCKLISICQSNDTCPQSGSKIHAVISRMLRVINLLHRVLRGLLCNQYGFICLQLPLFLCLLIATRCAVFVTHRYDCRVIFFQPSKKYLMLIQNIFWVWGYGIKKNKKKLKKPWVKAEKLRIR